MQEFKARRWDRRDGWRVEADDPVVSLTPYIMRTRLDSQVLFEETIPVDNLNRFVREHSEDIPGLSLMYIVMAAVVRMVSQRPCINRFVVHNKLYAHKDFKISIAIKHHLSDEGTETTIKPAFELTDTLPQVVAKAKAEIEASKPSDSVNATDKTARALAVIPSWIKRPFVNLMFRLDNVGLIPKALEEASPWHSSAFLTNTGSIGIDSVYHHLYEFGTCSFFIAVGKKSRTENEDGSTERTMRMKFVIDERICDGHYYALSMRYMRKLLLKPEKLLEPPKQVIYDHEIKSLRRAIAKAEKKKA